MLSFLRRLPWFDRRARPPRARELPIDSEPPVQVSPLRNEDAEPVLDNPEDYLAWLDAGQPESIAWWLAQPPSSRAAMAQLGSEWRLLQALLLARTIRDPDATARTLTGEEPAQQAPAAQDLETAAAIAEDLARRLGLGGRAPARRAGGAFEGFGERMERRRRMEAETLASSMTLGGIPATPAASP